ncbi:MAG: M48 family metallopeptidase [Acidimicrobiales bacterium]
MAYARSQTWCSGEQEAAEVTRQQLDSEWPLRGSGDALSSYIKALGNRVASRNDRSRAIDWRFHVVRNKAVNAFSIGAGNIYITDGAVNFVQNESELAGILAHEMGHELGGHFCRASFLRSLYDDLFGASDESREVRITGIGSIKQVIDPDKEREADKLAVRILDAGGFNPRAMIDLPRRLSSPETITHLFDPDRMKYLESYLANTPPVKAPSSEEFLKIKRALADERTAR